jgi:hypothetical protein
VQIQATPNTGWVFGSWSGSVTGTTNPTSVFMDGHKSVTATFAIATYTLTVDIAGSGTVTKIPNQPTYAHGTVVNRRRTHRSATFVSWRDTTAATNPLPVVMNRQKITMTFTLSTYALTVNVVGNEASRATSPAYGLGPVR